MGHVRYSIFSCVHFSSANPLQEPLPRSTLQPHLFLWPPPAPGPRLPDIKHRCWHLSHHCCPDHHQASESLPVGKRVKESTDFSAFIPGTSAQPLKKIDFPNTGDGPRGGAPRNPECLHSLAVTPCAQGSTLTGPQQQSYHSLHMFIADQFPSLCCFLPSWTFSNWAVSTSCHRRWKIHVCELCHLSLGQPAFGGRIRLWLWPSHRDQNTALGTPTPPPTWCINAGKWFNFSVFSFAISRMVTVVRYLP